MALPLKNHLKTLERVKNTSETRLGFLRLDKNENILPVPPNLLKKLRAAVTSEFITAYPEVDSLYKKIAKQEKCSEHNVYLSSGSDGAIKSVFEAFVDRGDKVVLLSPTYAMFNVYAKMYQVNLKEVTYHQNLALNIEHLMEVIKSEQPKLICIANPNSPTGTVIEPDQLKKIIDQAKEINAVILIDEAYYPFYPQSAAPLIHHYPNLVVTRTFSKAYGLASARLGFALGSEEMIQCLLKTRPMYETNAFAVRFAEVMLENQALVKKNLKEIALGKAYLEKELKKRKIFFFKSYTNFLSIEVGSREKAESVASALKKKKILVKNGFGLESLQRCIRLNVGNVSQMKAFLKAFISVYK